VLADQAIQGFTVNEERVTALVGRNPIIVTALNPVIGYEKGAKIAKRAYAEAGITDPRREISMMEVHDCFSITEAVLMEDLGFSAPGRVIHDVLDDFVREAILLEIPIFPLCSEDCPGIRPASSDVVDEEAEPRVDPRLAPLGALRAKLAQSKAGPDESTDDSGARPRSASASHRKKTK